jgi:hypothetical protein
LLVIFVYGAAILRSFFKLDLARQRLHRYKYYSTSSRATYQNRTVPITVHELTPSL